MNPRAIQLARRRERLVQRSAELRRRAAWNLQDVQPALLWLDRLQDAVLWLRGSPFVAAAGTLLLSIWRPRRAASLGMRLWNAWKLVQQVRRQGTAPVPRRR